MTSKKYDFTGKVVLITGSSSGIGAACAVQFAQCGAKVVVTGLEEEEVQQVSDRIEQITGEKPFSMSGNLAADGFTEALVKGTVGAYDRIDVLINNAGRVTTGDCFTNPDFLSDYEKIMDLNLKSVFKLIHHCVPHLEATKGCIINTSSVLGMVPARKPLYCASKAAVNMLTKVAALELGDKGIRVNSVK